MASAKQVKECFVEIRLSLEEADALVGLLCHVTEKTEKRIDELLTPLFYEVAEALGDFQGNDYFDDKSGHLVLQTED